MTPELDLGMEQTIDEDRVFASSRFREVVDALFANPYQRIWGGAGEPPLPVYEVSLGNFLFNHPTWRADRNDPATATRVDFQKVR